MATRTTKTLPYSVSDILMHGKDSDRTERVVLPITRYANVMNAPNVVSESIKPLGAPFHLLKTKTVELTDAEIVKLCGHIL